MSSVGEFDDDELWNYYGSGKVRNLEQAHAPPDRYRESDAPSKNPAPESGQPPWERSRERDTAQNAPLELTQARRKRAKEHGATAELSNEPAPASSRLSQAPVPPSGIKYRIAVPLAGVAMVMVAGIVGYKLGSTLPASPPRPAPRPTQFDQSRLVSEQLVPPAQPFKTAPLLSASPRPLAFIKKGEDLFATGNVGAARLFYERAAEAGLAEGALALAATFDPNELARRQVFGGVQPDPAAAWRWYERALELRASDAENHLRRLGPGNP